MDDLYCPTCRSAPLITDFCPNCSRTPTPGIDAWVKGLPEYDADREKVSLRLKVRHLLDVLESIANADPRKWEPDMRDQFQQWAQNRARHTIEKVGAGDTATEGHNELGHRPETAGGRNGSGGPTGSASGGTE